MAVLTYLGAEATNAIEPVCVEFNFTKLSTFTDYWCGQEVDITPTAIGHNMCVTWSWDTSGSRVKRMFA